jgi:hypothetical protein
MTNKLFLTLRSLTIVCVALVLLMGTAGPAHAVPSFSRQMGVSCSVCHTAYPKLTWYGRQFKSRGYTTTAIDQITEKIRNHTVLGLTKAPPVAASLTGSYTVLQKKESGTQNGAVLVPDELSIFYAGRIAPELGAFTQLTYDSQEDHVSMDMLDLRYAHAFDVDSKLLVLGVTVNNTPTGQDLWNSTPAWGWPFVTSGAWPGMGSNAALIDGPLAQAVGGMGVYLFWNDMVYLEGTVYRSAPLGSPRFLSDQDANVIQHVAPYWRLAGQHQIGNSNFELGIYGLYAGMRPGAAAGLPIDSGPTDKYFDWGVDGQYQYFDPGRLFSFELHSTWIYERRRLDASVAGASPRLNTFRVDGQTYCGPLGGSAGFFLTSGSRNAGAFGTESGRPNTNGGVFSVIYRPWLNTSFRAQYTVYGRYDGRFRDYAGTRDAWNNDALSLLAWVTY